MNKKVEVATLSIFSNAILIVLKVVVGVLTGSISIISEAIHSSVDMIASFVTFLSVKVSDKPSDDEHPWGNGKYENVSGVIESILILIATLYIIWESILKLIDIPPVQSISYGFIVMFISAIINLFLSKKLYKVARKTESVAIESDALNHKTDVYTSLGEVLV